MKSKFTYNSWGITFDGADKLSCGKDFAQNVIIFGVDNSSSNDTDNLRNSFLVSGKGLVLVLGLGLVLTLLKQIQNLIWVYLTMVVEVVYMCIKQRIVNLSLMIKYLSINFV